ncbi:hypothetical protein Desti_5000 [Desulfomonile tiedjei DSM 6799]|uniref:Uncharacterized protein n=1 Tax=Desulfomonile tiedjei (strain ATCC 49306 / DSM 6799 / DCB-1) TaxID=706587 RepID=I4CDH1_DESTA|nr:hypothetical protein Desti_5000 [Desulfomonile tiedjei DSM 6799]
MLSSQFKGLSSFVVALFAMGVGIIHFIVMHIRSRRLGASLPVHSIDIIDHIEDVPARRPAPTNTPIVNRTLTWQMVHSP